MQISGESTHKPLKVIRLGIGCVMTRKSPCFAGKSFPQCTFRLRPVGAAVSRFGHTMRPFRGVSRKEVQPGGRGPHTHMGTWAHGIRFCLVAVGGSNPPTDTRRRSLTWVCGCHESGDRVWAVALVACWLGSAFGQDALAPPYQLMDATG